MVTRAERYVDAGYIARRLKVSAETVRAWIRSGKLDAIETPTGLYRIPFSELTRLLESKKTQNTQNAQNTQGG